LVANLQGSVFGSLNSGYRLGVETDTNGCGGILVKFPGSPERFTRNWVPSARIYLNHKCGVPVVKMGNGVPNGCSTNTIPPSSKDLSLFPTRIYIPRAPIPVYSPNSWTPNPHLDQLPGNSYYSKERGHNFPPINLISPKGTRINSNQLCATPGPTWKISKAQHQLDTLPPVISREVRKAQNPGKCTKNPRPRLLTHRMVLPKMYI